MRGPLFPPGLRAGEDLFGVFARALAKEDLIDPGRAILSRAVYPRRRPTIGCGRGRGQRRAGR